MLSVESPPLNQLGLFWKAGQQYNPDFLVETTAGKFMVEVKALNEVTSDEVVSKRKRRHKVVPQLLHRQTRIINLGEYKLISDIDNIFILVKPPVNIHSVRLMP
ncbi:MAG: hypothetical protein ACLUOO_03110 [Coprococcus sp.]